MMVGGSKIYKCIVNIFNMQQQNIGPYMINISNFKYF